MNQQPQANDKIEEGRVASDYIGPAVVQLMGNKTVIGSVKGVRLFGVYALRVDFPAVPGRAAFTRYYSTNAFYGVTPCSAKEMLAFAERANQEQFMGWLTREEGV